MDKRIAVILITSAVLILIGWVITHCTIFEIRGIFQGLRYTKHIACFV